LRVTDAFAIDRLEALESALISLYPVVIEEDRAFIRGGGLVLVVSVSPGTRFERTEALAYRARNGEEAFVHRLVWTPEVLAGQCETEVEFALA
jgi:hypothetical protein